MEAVNEMDEIQGLFIQNIYFEYHLYDFQHLKGAELLLSTSRLINKRENSLVISRSSGNLLGSYRCI